MGRKVWVGLNGDVDVGEDLVVVCPCWVGEVDCLVVRAGEEFGEEEGSKVEGACARDGLESCYLYYFCENPFGCRVGLG